eukprot:334239-Prorocentrum_minimum.AAC.2
MALLVILAKYGDLYFGGDWGLRLLKEAAEGGDGGRLMYSSAGEVVTEKELGTERDGGVAEGGAALEGRPRAPAGILAPLGACGRVSVWCQCCMSVV